MLPSAAKATGTIADSVPPAIDDVHVAVLDEPLRLDERLHAGGAGRHRR